MSLGCISSTFCCTALVALGQLKTIIGQSDNLPHCFVFATLAEMARACSSHFIVVIPRYQRLAACFQAMLQMVFCF